VGRASAEYLIAFDKQVENNEPQSAGRLAQLQILGLLNEMEGFPPRFGTVLGFGGLATQLTGCLARRAG